MKAQNTLFSLLFTLLLSTPQFGSSQTLTGLWQVSRVTVGEHEMTPVAKWFRLNEAGTYTTGNGWLQNGAGTWTYQPQTNSLRAIETNGLQEEGDTFTVSKLRRESMQWQREEGGQLVSITLDRIDQLPRSLADKLSGLWDLVEETTAEQSSLASTDPPGKYRLFIRWDRLYTEYRGKDESTTGYWYINAHQPQLEFIPLSAEGAGSSWTVRSITDQQLVLEGRGALNQHLTRTFKRLKRFPK